MSDMQQIDDALAGKVAAKLRELQGSRSDDEMGRLLGCTREHYWNVRKERRRPSYEMVKRAVVVFPELLPIVMRDLTGAA